MKNSTVETDKETEPFVYEIGGGWGDRIEWFGDTRLPKTLNVAGWKERIPKIGDVLRSQMQSGRMGEFIFTKVKPCHNPPDMFFGDVVFKGYV